MASSAVLVCLAVLGVLCLAEAAPAPDLENLVKAAKYLYEGLSQAMFEAQIQDLTVDDKSQAPSGEMHQQYTFHGEVNDMYVTGK